MVKYRYRRERERLSEYEIVDMEDLKKSMSANSKKHKRFEQLNNMTPIVELLYYIHQKNKN
jgi:hypothetical protein